MKGKDRLFDSEITRPEDFVFDDRVVSVFPDMINRSIPGYAQLVPMIGMLARRYAQPRTRLYDLGCSLGAVALAMQASVEAPGVEIHAVDNSAEMIGALETRLAEPREGVPIKTQLADIQTCPIENASVVVLNFTLQFVPPAGRNALLARISQGLVPGGVVLLSEKIRFDDPEEQKIQERWHHDFKRAQGYSELEIARKRDALENVMKPESRARHLARLEASGLGTVYQWYQGFNFISLLAFKAP